MTLLDGALLVLVGVAAVTGAVRGAISQLAGMVGAVAGLLGGVALVPAAAGAVSAGPGGTRALVVLGVVVGGGIVGHALGAAAGRLLARRVADAGARGPDRIAGAAVGAAAAVLGVWLVAAALVTGPWPGVASALQSSTVATRIGQALGPPPDVVGRVATHLDEQGFPQVTTRPFAVDLAPDVDGPTDAEVAAAADAGRASVVQVEGTGCGGRSLGSGAAVSVPGQRPAGLVLTAAHVVAGAEGLIVRDGEGQRAATPVAVDADLDVAVLAVEDLAAVPLRLADEAPERGSVGAVLGFPNGDRDLRVLPAAVRAATTLIGRDVYGRGSVARDVLVLSADVERGASGGPLVTPDGALAGVVFAASSSEPGVGFALQPGAVDEVLAQAADGDPVDTGACVP